MFPINVARSAAPTSRLFISIDSILTRLSTEERSCIICTAKWKDKEEFEKIARAVYVQGYNSGTDSLTLDIGQRSVVITEGFGNVPLWLGCGYVFCAGCVKHWLDSPDARLPYPFRDLNSVFQGGEAVHGLKRALWNMTDAADYEAV